jgi:Cu+-exporting ATPase
MNEQTGSQEPRTGLRKGTGTDVAMESSSVTLVKGDLRRIPSARLLPSATMRKAAVMSFSSGVGDYQCAPVAARIRLTIVCK